MIAFTRGDLYFYYICQGRENNTCDLPSMPVADVEAHSGWPPFGEWCSCVSVGDPLEDKPARRGGRRNDRVRRRTAR